MNNITELLKNLYSKDNNIAYKCLKLLELESEHSNAIYEFFDIFVEMIDDNNSYIRTRGLILISANAKLDVENKIDEIIDNYLKHILDVKPIIARQCIKALPNIMKHRRFSTLYKDIRSALQNIK